MPAPPHFLLSFRATHSTPHEQHEKKIGRLSAGSCFGATGALHGGGLRKESVTCVTDCEMYTIEGKALRRIARCVRAVLGLLPPLRVRGDLALSRSWRQNLMRGMELVLAICMGSSSSSAPLFLFLVGCAGRRPMGLPGAFWLLRVVAGCIRV